MIGIPVSIAPATAEGRLHPRYRNSIGIMTFDAERPRPCRFGVNIDGTLILDFDDDAVLAGVELILPMSRWRGKADMSRPEGTAGNIVLAAPRLASTGHDWRVSVSKCAQAETARIALGDGAYDRAVHLSDACSALLLGDRLTGFWFSLRR